MGRRPNKINNANISVDAKIIGFSEGYALNERFEVRKVSILSWDEYGNRFHFSKPLIDSKDYQLDMLPVVGFHDGDGFTSHDERAVPYGAVIPNSARWEVIDDKEYKVVDVAFWKGRYSELNDLESCNQSMEIVGISGTYIKEMGIFETEDYTYDALCVLGENVAPAYSKARVFNLSDIKDEFNIFKEEFNALFNANKTEEGGGLVENEQLESIKEDEKVEDVNLENNESVDDKDDKNQEDIVDNENFKDEKPSCNKSFELSHDDIMTAIWNQINPIGEDGCREWNYWVMEVFDTYFVCNSENETNKYYRFTFEKNHETGEVLVDIGSKTEVFVAYLTQEEKDVLKQKDEKFNELTESYSALKDEVEGLRQFKENVEEVQAKEKAEMELKAKNEELEKFSAKLSKKEISEEIDNVNNFSLEEIRTKLSVVLANKLLSENTNFNDNAFINIDNTDKTYSRSERLLAELKNKKIIKKDVIVNGYN